MQAEGGISETSAWVALASAGEDCPPTTPTLAFIPCCNKANVRIIISSMKDVSKAASLMGKRSAQAREKKWGKKEFVRRMQEWGKLGGRPKGTGTDLGRGRKTTEKRAVPVF